MSFETGNLLAAVILFLHAILFIGIGSWAVRRQAPVHFWAGTTVKSELIKDIPAYNRANGCMWHVYGSGWIVSALGFLFNTWVGFTLTMLLCTIGIGGLIITYKKIYKKYIVDNGVEK